MDGPEGSLPPPRRSLLHSAVVRWAVAGSVATSITVVLFLGMTRLIDGSFILDRMLRVFPLEQTPLVDPCQAWEAPQTLVSIDGIVGYYASSGFVPLSDADIVGEHAPDDGQRVEVSPEGLFRFVTGFADERPEACAESGADAPAAKRLIIRAVGCEDRAVPVTRSWIPHRVLLECRSRV